MNLRKLVLVALFIALSFIGASIKIFGTIAFDSLPAFLGALLLGPVYGAIIGFLGHLFTALLSGFPYGIVVHSVIAISMAITMIGFSCTYKFLKNKVSLPMNFVITAIVGAILNGPVALALSYPFLVPLMGGAGTIALLPVLTIAGVVNIIISMVLFSVFKRYGAKIYANMD